MKIVVVHATCDFRLPLIRTKGGLLLQHEVLFVDVVTASRLAPRVSGRNPSLHPASRDARLDLSIQEDRPHSATFLSLSLTQSLSLYRFASYHPFVSRRFVVEFKQWFVGRQEHHKGMADREDR